MTHGQETVKQTSLKGRLHSNPTYETKYLNSSSSVEVDIFPLPLHMDDILLLCSHGVWKLMHPTDVQHILNASVLAPSQIASILLETALARGGTDAMSSIVVSLSDK